jgi:hypothetical protein
MLSTRVTVHADPGPVGFVDVTTFPAWSVATHRVVVGQEIAKDPVPPMLVGPAHADAGPVGFVDVNTRPKLSRLTHNVVEGHETASILTGAP